MIFALIGTASSTDTNRTVSPSAHLFAENITVTLNAASIPVNGSLYINGTTNRWASNGTKMFCTISTGADRTREIINGTLMDVIADFNETSGLATYSILWNSIDDIAEIEASSTVSWNTFNETYYITVNDSSAKNTTQTFRITDSITVFAVTGIPGYNFTARGTSSRENGTLVNVTLQTQSGIPIRYADAYVYDNAWNVTMNASTVADDGTDDQPLPAVEPYTIIANDSIVKAQSTLTLPECWNPWDDDGVITTLEIQDAVYRWLTDTPMNGHQITTPEMQELVDMWLTT